MKACQRLIIAVLAVLACQAQPALAGARVQIPIGNVAPSAIGFGDMDSPYNPVSTTNPLPVTCVSGCAGSGGGGGGGDASAANQIIIYTRIGDTAAPAAGSVNYRLNQILTGLSNVTLLNTSFGISGTLPAFASTPTVNLGTLNGAATAAAQASGNGSLATIATNTASTPPPYAFTPRGFVQLTAVSTSTGFTPPTNSTVCFISSETNAVRYRTDGTAPTASVGALLPVGAQLQLSGSLAAFRAIPTSGSTIIDIDCYS